MGFFIWLEAERDFYSLPNIFQLAFGASTPMLRQSYRYMFLVQAVPVGALPEDSALIP